MLAGTATGRAQFAGCSTGLLQMPTAEMPPDGTFTITNNFLNKHALPTSGWTYNTFQYGFSISLFGRIELGYVCTLFNDYWKGSQTRKGVWLINQDRHFVGRIQLLREGDFGQDWLPALVIGSSDPITAVKGSGDYLDGDVSGSANGYFNRNYIVLSKHFETQLGRVGTHVGYQYNHRIDYSINAPCAGVDWRPTWFENKGILDEVDLVLEYDSRTINTGFIASIWDSRFRLMFELQGFRWINFGLRYNVLLRK